jgi:hypothetical protein
MKKLIFYLALFLCANFASSFQLPSLQDSFFLLVLGLVFIPVWACPPPPDLGSPDTEFFHCSSPPFGSRFPLANFPKHLFPLVFDLSRTSFTAPWFSSVFGPHAACLGPVCVSSSIPAPVFRLCSLSQLASDFQPITAPVLLHVLVLVPISAHDRRAGLALTPGQVVPQSMRPRDFLVPCLILYRELALRFSRCLCRPGSSSRWFYFVRRLDYDLLTAAYPPLFVSCLQTRLGDWLWSFAYSCRLSSAVFSLAGQVVLLGYRWFGV